jgi:hypothetical protein
MKEDWQKPLARNVFKCDFCGGPVDRFANMFQCRRCRAIADLNTRKMVRAYSPGKGRGNHEKDRR